jgi:hypothetical protein
MVTKPTGKVIAELWHPDHAIQMNNTIVAIAVNGGTVERGVADHYSSFYIRQEYIEGVDPEQPEDE